MIGKPVFQYKIPHEAWYFIVTSSGLHFYFDKSKPKSYWQLYDVFEDNPGIDQNEFINCINMDEIAMLMSRVNGLKGLDGYFFKESKKNEKDLQTESIDVNSTGTGSRAEEGVEKETIDKQETMESEEEEDEVVEYDKYAKEEFIRNLLLEEGYIQEETEKKDEETPGGLNLGYSSSEEDSEAEDDQDIKNDQDDEEEIGHNEADDDKRKNINEDHSEVDAAYQGQKEKEKDYKIHNEEQNEENEEGHDEHNIHEADDSDDETQNNLGLDLSLSEDERDTTKDFLKLLDFYKDRISVYDPWFLIEEELLPEFITKPEYYSIDDSSERERIFNQWCKTQQGDEPQKTIADAGVQQSEVYPTVTQMYFRYLQNHKKELKKYFYSEFTKFSNEIDIKFCELLAKERETFYRQYKIMITDYAEYEKKMKKSGLNDANLKKLRLITFLNKNSKNLPNDAKRKDVLQVENSTEDAFSKWAKICNLYNIPTSIGNSVENFIVGDEKRLQSYIETITRP